MRPTEGGWEVICTLAMSLCLTAGLPLVVEAHGNHPKPGKRVGQCAKPGQQTGRIARHVAGYAVDRYELRALLSQDDLERAGREMNHFLRWKLGGKVAVCAQYVSTGYGHFERAYGDEAAAVLLGVIHFGGEEPEIYVPDWMLTFIENTLELTEPSIYGFLGRRLGLPEPVQVRLYQQIHAKLVDKTMDALASVKAFMPHKYDVKNQLVEETIAVRREAAHTTASSLDVIGKSKGALIPKSGTLSRGTFGKKGGGRSGPTGSIPDLSGTGKGGGSSSDDPCQIDPASDACYCAMYPGDEYCSGSDQYATDDLPAGPAGYEEFEDSDFQAGQDESGRFDPFGADSGGGYSDQGPMQGDVPWYEKLGGGR